MTPRPGRWRRLRLALLLVGGSGAIGVLGLFVAVLGWPYDVARLRPADATSLTVVDREGVPLRQLALRGGGRATWVPLAQVPATLIAATLASEDQGFYQHPGVDLTAAVRALWLNLRGRRLAFGGSTLSMQLVRLVQPHGRTLSGKLADVVRALRLERATAKPVILEQYVNRAYYGNGAFGVEAAARRYFGKAAPALSEGEATFLAVLPRAPTAYDPRRPGGADAAIARWRHVLDLLVAQGRLAPEARARLLQSPPRPLPAQAAARGDGVAQAPFLAPHFVDWVIGGLPGDVRQAGAVVHTTLDRHLQGLLERAVREHVAALSRRHVTHAGVVVLATRSGEVLGMVGSPDYFAAVGGQINIATTPRHPGSALKSFTYGLALELGDTPATIAWDVNDIHSAYVTRNADGRQHGPVRYRVALACSYNLAAVHIAERIGVGRLLGRLRDAGLTTLDRPADAYGPALTLGAGPVRLVDLAAAYTAFGNGGAVAPARAVTSVVAPDGTQERPAMALRRQIFSQEVSWLVMDMLADQEARRPAFGDDLPFDLPFPVAAKTGTSGGFSDNVAVLVTREYTVAAWAGNFDGSGMHAVLAMAGAAPLARAAILAAADGRRLSLPPRPAGIVEAPVCSLSGQAPGPLCPRKLERFVRAQVPTLPCPWHRADPTRPDGVRVDWPPEAAPWADRRQRAGGRAGQRDAQNANWTP